MTSYGKESPVVDRRSEKVFWIRRGNPYILYTILQYRCTVGSTQTPVERLYKVLYD